MAADEQDHLRAGAVGRGRVGLVYRIDHIAGLAGALGDHLLLQLLGVHLLLKLGFADVRAELGRRDERMRPAAPASSQTRDRFRPFRLPRPEGFPRLLSSPGPAIIARGAERAERPGPGGSPVPSGGSPRARPGRRGGAGAAWS